MSKDTTNFDEVKKIVKKNDTYAEADKKKEEHERIEREPVGDWQSPSNNRRWNALHKELELKRITYNIEKSTNKEKEKEILEESIDPIKAEIKNNLAKMAEIETMKEPWFFKRSFHYKMNDKKDSIKTENRKLEGLLEQIKLQLTVYSKYLENKPNHNGGATKRKRRSTRGRSTRGRR